MGTISSTGSIVLKFKGDNTGTNTVTVTGTLNATAKTGSGAYSSTSGDKGTWKATKNTLYSASTWTLYHMTTADTGTGDTGQGGTSTLTLTTTDGTNLTGTNVDTKNNSQSITGTIGGDGSFNMQFADGNGGTVTVTGSVTSGTFGTTGATMNGTFWTQTAIRGPGTRRRTNAHLAGRDAPGPPGAS